MSTRNGGGRFGKNERRKSALKRKKAFYEEFKKAGKDKEPWTTTRNGGKKVINHPGRSYESECSRLNEEINRLNSLIF